jgi:hypothetical protein
MFDAKQLEEGIRVEMEHTSDPEMAKKIAKQHLREDKMYYAKLRPVEGKPLMKSRNDKDDLKKSILKKARSKAEKFESCVTQVKEKSPDVNPWAVCRASLKKSIMRRACSKPETLSKSEQGHPVLNQGKFAILTATDPVGPSAGTNDDLAKELHAAGYTFEPTEGKYKDEHTTEHSFLVHNPDFEHVKALGKKYGQESVILSHGGQHRMHYTFHPEHEGKAVSGAGHDVFSTPPKMYYTKTHVNGKPLYFSLNFHWDSPMTTEPLQKSDLGWSHDDLQDVVREARTEERLAKADVLSFRSKLKAKVGTKENIGPHEGRMVSLDEPQGKLTVTFTHKHVSQCNAENHGVIHHELPSAVHGDILAQHPAYLKKYLNESGLEPTARAKGVTKICLHIPEVTE